MIGTRLHRLASAGNRRSQPYQSPVVWPPPVTYQQMRQLASRALPDVRYRRHLYWRYSLVWTNPS